MVETRTATPIDVGSVQVLDGVVPPDIHRTLLALVPRIGWQFGAGPRNASTRFWRHELAGGGKTSGHDLTQEVREQRLPIFSRYIDWLRAELIPVESRLLRLYFDGNTFGTDGPAQAGSARVGEVTFLLHLTRNWKADFGGETVVYDAAGDVETSILPKENRLIAFPSERLHGTRPLSRVFGGLRVVLVARFGLGAQAPEPIARAIN